MIKKDFSASKKISSAPTGIRTPSSNPASIDKCYNVSFSLKNFAFKSRQVIRLPESIKNSLFSKFATGKFSNKKTGGLL